MAEKYQFFDGKKFTRDDKTGYYLCSTGDENNVRKRMHVYVCLLYTSKMKETELLEITNQAEEYIESIEKSELRIKMCIRDRCIIIERFFN